MFDCKSGSLECSRITDCLTRSFESSGVTAAT